MTTDTLYLLDPAFPDDRYPGRTFFCPDCITVEGLLRAFPDSTANLIIIRIPYPRPRADIVALLGEENQNLPVLVLGDDAPDGIADGVHNGVRFVGGMKALLQALHIRHGFPEPHP